METGIQKTNRIFIPGKLEKFENNIPPSYLQNKRLESIKKNKNSLIHLILSLPFRLANKDLILSLL